MIGKVIKVKETPYYMVVIDKILNNGNTRYLCVEIKVNTKDGGWEIVKGTENIKIVFPEWIIGFNTDKVIGL